MSNLEKQVDALMRLCVAEEARDKDHLREEIKRMLQLRKRGELDPEQLWTTTMDPKNRIMLKVNIDDAMAAERAVSDLMGTTVEKRKDFIQTHAKDVRFLDI